MAIEEVLLWDFSSPEYPTLPSTTTFAVPNPHKNPFPEFTDLRWELVRDDMIY